MLQAVRAVLARYAAVARGSADWRSAYAIGHRYWMMYYGWGIVERLADEIAGQRRLGRIVWLISCGLQYDRRFILRMGRRLLRALMRR